MAIVTMTDVVNGVAVDSSSVSVSVTQGSTGPTGPKGDQGDPGDPGSDGKSISAGSGAPSASGNVGDLYVDTATGDLYQFS